MTRSIKKLLFAHLVTATLLMCISCQTTHRLADHNLSDSYAISDISPLPDYILYQFTPDSLRIYFSIPARSGAGDETKRWNKGFILYASIISPENRKVIHDSATYYIIAEDTNINSGILNGSIEIFTGEPSGKLLSLNLTDPENNATNEYYQKLPSAWPPTSTHFVLYDHHGQPLNHRNISTNSKFFFTSSIITDNDFKVRYYRNEYPVAYPPFVNIPFQHFNYEADSVFNVSFKDGKTGDLELSMPGIYHFTADTTSRIGFTIFARDYPFPWIAQSAQMIAPLRYITSDKEYRELEESPDPKEAVDRFWVNTAGNELRARKLIREYYRRVEKANYLFTSYQDGWKTDRGMIYIMFGTPSIVQRTEHAEIWTYGESRHLLSFSFIFIKVNNPFSDNDYLLERSPNFKTGWYQMVNSWRR